MKRQKLSGTEIISRTGEIHGRGSAQFRWVSYLSPAERQAVRDGKTVIIEDPERHTHNQTQYKMVTYHLGRYSHRNYYGPDPEGDD